MNTKKQIFIDKVVFSPLARLLNVFVRIAGKVLFIDHSLQKEFKTIAVCKFKGMGSIIQSTPMLEALRKRFPNAEIIYVSTEANKKFLQQISLIDTIVTVNDKSFLSSLTGSLKAIFILIRKRPEVYIDLEIYSNFSTIFTTLTLSKNRIGFYLRSSSFRMGIYTHMMFFNPKIPVSEVYLQIARLFGNFENSPEVYRLNNQNLENSFFQNENYIVINPNASDLRLERRWDKSNFIELIKKISANYVDLKIVLIGSNSEFEYTQTIKNQVSDIENVLNLAGKTSIQELISLISIAKCVITNDTGPMHIAFSCKTPSVCLFGPCSPQQYGMSDKTFIIYKNVYCSPCVHDFEIPPCKGNNICMKLIQTDEVYSAFESVIKNVYKSDNICKSAVYFSHDEILGLVKRSK